MSITLSRQDGPFVLAEWRRFAAAAPGVAIPGWTAESVRPAVTTIALMSQARVEPAPRRPLRVGIYTFRIVEHPTGLAKYAMDLTRAMAHVDDSLEIVLLSPYRENPHHWYTEFPVHYVGPPGTIHPWPGLLVAPVMLRRAAAQLRLDVVHAPANVAPFVGLPKTVRRIATVHDLAPLTLPREHRLISRIGYASAIPSLRWTADAILTVSPQSADELVRVARLPREKVIVTPNGVDVPSDQALADWRRDGVPTLGLPPSGRFFLFVGDIRPRKNVKRLLQAFAGVRAAYPDVDMVLAGQGMHRIEEIRAETEQLGNSLIQTGYIDDDTLHRLYSNAIALVMPSLAEGFGLPALEAMAHGTTPIVSRLPVLDWLVGNVGIAVDPLSVASMRDGMVSAIERSRADETLRARAKTFDREATARGTLAAYRGR